MLEMSPQMAYAIVLLPIAGCAGLLAVVVLGERISWFFQLVKYGAIGVLATALQTGVFYVLAATCLGCLSPDDVAVRLLGMPASDVGDAVRAFRFAVATGAGFVVANIFCWLMNRAFVFRPETKPDVGRVEKDAEKLRALRKTGFDQAERLMAALEDFLKQTDIPHSQFSIPH